MRFRAAYFLFAPLLFNNFLIFQQSFSESDLIEQILLIYSKFLFYLKSKKYDLLKLIYELVNLYKFKPMSYVVYWMYKNNNLINNSG